MLDWKFNEAWNEVNRLNEANSNSANNMPAIDSVSYSEIKTLLDELSSQNNSELSDKSYTAAASKLNSLQAKAWDLRQDIIAVKSEIKNEVKPDIDINLYSKLKAFEKQLNDWAYKGSKLGGPQRLALFYDTFLFESEIDSNESVKKTICDIIGRHLTSTLTGKEADQPSGSCALIWNNKRVDTPKLFSDPDRNADFTFSMGSIKVGVEAKIAIFNMDQDKFATAHTHRASYILRYMPDSKKLIIYCKDPTDNSTTKFISIGSVDFVVNNYIDLNKFSSHWPSWDKNK